MQFHKLNSTPHAVYAMMLVFEVCHVTKNWLVQLSWPTYIDIENDVIAGVVNAYDITLPVEFTLLTLYSGN